MLKRIFLYKNGLANKLNPVGANLFAFWLCLLSSSCDSNLVPGDNGSGDTSPVALHFSTSVEKLSSTAHTRAINNGGVIEGATFPQGDNEIGMFITRNSTASNDVFPGSADNMKATLTRNSDGGESWTYVQKDGTPTIPEGYIGKNIQVVAYWPYNPSATAAGIPFDFTNINDVGQTELLYNKQERQKLKIGSGGQIPLEFAHAYSRIILNLRKAVNAGTIQIHSASVINQSGTWIKNKGMINPATGYPTDDSESGDITDATSQELTTSGVKYEFLVPAFTNESVTDGDVGLKLLVAGRETIFELKKEHLNKWTVDGITKYGFRQGYKNTYNLVYDNLTMSLQLRGWTIVTPESDIGLPITPDENYKGWLFDHNDITVPDPPPTTTVSDHQYEALLTDQDRGNNGVGNAIWLPDYPTKESFHFVWQQEPPRSPIDFALSDVLSTPVQWRGKDGIMVAKQLCKDYREGGYSNWRLPRMAEWYMFMKRIETSYDYLYYPQQYGGKLPSENWYWSGTESLGDVQIIKLTISQTDMSIQGSTLSPSSMALVRCVRDADPITN